MTLLIPELLETKTYAFAKLRRAWEHQRLQEGVTAGATDMKVSQRAAGGAGMFVDVAAGGAWVRGDDTARQGLYHTENDATVTLAVPANASGNPRLDQVIARVYDSTIIGGALDLAQFEYITGTPTIGATKDNRLGAASLPNTAVRLADVLVASGAVSVLDADIRDRRPRANGAYHHVKRTAGTGTSSVTSYATLFTAELLSRLEIASGKVSVRFSGHLSTAANAYSIYHRPAVDGVGEQERLMANPTAASLNHPFDFFWIIDVTPGWHTFQMQVRANAAFSTSWLSDATSPATWEIEEILRTSVEAVG